MAKKELNKIIERNPKVDKKLFESGMKKLKELNKLGIEECQFNLDSPHSRTLKYRDSDEIVCNFNLN